jgi:hypothetical protein
LVKNASLQSSSRVPYDSLEAFPTFVQILLDLYDIQLKHTVDHYGLNYYIDQTFAVLRISGHPQKVQSAKIITAFFLMEVKITGGIHRLH